MSNQFLKALLVGFLVIILVVFGYPLFLPASYSVNQKKIINSSIDKVYTQTLVLDSLKNWNLFFDQDLQYVLDSQKIEIKYPWRSKSFGSGQICIDSTQDAQSIVATIFIEQPFESKIKVYWKFVTIDSTHTTIECNVKGGLSYPFGRFLAGQTMTFINNKIQKSFNKLEQKYSN